MQQSLYNSIDSIRIQQSASTKHRTGWGQLARNWDLYGVLALMASSASYGLFVLVHAL